MYMKRTQWPRKNKKEVKMAKQKTRFERRHKTIPEFLKDYWKDEKEESEGKQVPFPFRLIHVR
jgi:hypothetical protein